MKSEEKSTLGFMIVTGGSVPAFFIAAILDISQMARLTIVLTPVVIGLILMMTSERRKKI